MRDAAADLRAAVHELSLRSTGSHPDAAALARAAALVRAAATELDGPVLPPWWDGPVDGGDLGLQAYRHRSLFQGELHPFSPALRWEDSPGPEGTPGRAFRVVLSRLVEGPPSSVHGGYVAGLFDELLGGVQGLAEGGGGYTARLTVRYRALTPIDTELRFAGWIVRDGGRRIVTEATCHAPEGTLTAEAEGLFVRPASRTGQP